MAQLKAGSTVGGNTIVTEGPAVVPLNALTIIGTKAFTKVVAVKENSLVYSDVDSSLQIAFSAGGTFPPSGTASSVIDKFPMSAPFTTAISSGNLSSTRAMTDGHSSSTEGFSSGSGGIDKFPFTASFTTATSAGALSPARRVVTHSSSTEGFASGPLAIDKFPFSAPFTTATNVGSLSKTIGETSTGHSSSTEGFVRGVATFSTNEFEKFPFSAPFVTATSLSSGPIPPSGYAVYEASVSSPSDGYIIGGYGPVVFIDSLTTFTKFPFSAPHVPAVNVGSFPFVDSSAGHSSGSKGFSSSGKNRGSAIGSVREFPFSVTPATTTLLGALSQVRYWHSGHEY